MNLLYMSSVGPLPIHFDEKSVCEQIVHPHSIFPYNVYRYNCDFSFMLLIFVLTDANEATYSIEFDSNFSL